MAFRYTDLEVTDPLDREARLTENAVHYVDSTGELGFMASRFDSFLRNDPGYAITIAATNDNNAGNSIQNDKWYLFEV